MAIVTVAYRLVVGSLPTYVVYKRHRVELERASAKVSSSKNGAGDRSIVRL